MKVLHVLDKNTGNGTAQFVINYYRHINLQNFQFDFLSSSANEDSNTAEIRKHGGVIYNAPGYKRHLLKYIIYVYRVIMNNNYDIIHCHQFMADIISLIISRMKGIKTRIFHAHNSTFHSLIKRLLVHFFRYIWVFVVTDFFACSDEAGYFFFRKKYKYKIINNAIEPECYIFNGISRINIRNNLSLAENAFVIGYVARFTKQKNHKFLLDIFRHILEKNNNSYLLLIGDGKLMENTKKYAVAMNIMQNIIFFGLADNANELYSAMDIFVFPSLYEGLPIVGIEAQCSGLPVIASTKIPKEMQITNLVYWLDLKIGAEKWAEKVLEFTVPQKRQNMTDIITQNGYNINREYIKLETEYTRLIHSLEKSEN